MARRVYHGQSGDRSHPYDRGLSMDFPSPSSSCETASNEKDEKFQNADLSASIPSIMTRPLDWAKKTPFLKPCSRHSSSLLSRPSRKGYGSVRHVLQHTQVELHHVPADDDVRIMFGKPGVEFSSNCGRLATYTSSKSVGGHRHSPDPAYKRYAGRSLPDQCNTVRRVAWFRYPARPI